MTSALALSTGSARPVSMTSDMSASGGSGLYGDHIGRQQLIAARTESEQTPLDEFCQQLLSSNACKLVDIVYSM